MLRPCPSLLSTFRPITCTLAYCSELRPNCGAIFSTRWVPTDWVSV